jgi:hypothetical protein
MTSKEAKVQFAMRAMELSCAISYPLEIRSLFSRQFEQRINEHCTILAGEINVSRTSIAFLYSKNKSTILLIDKVPYEEEFIKPLTNLSIEDLEKLVNHYLKLKDWRIWKFQTSDTLSEKARGIFGGVDNI